jgi:hypothetical protein
MNDYYTKNIYNKCEISCESNIMHITTIYYISVYIKNIIINIKV